MKNEEIKKLSQKIEDISAYFEGKPFTGNAKLLKANFDIKTLNTPQYYWSVIEDLEELLRESRLMFLYSVLDKICKEERKLYYFDTPFQSSMKYNAVMRKEGDFYLQDEDGDFREMFVNENFVRFIDDLYWELYENEE